MANSKSSIYPIQLKNAELNLNKYDAEIKQYTGFNKNNAPFVGGCLSNLFVKDKTLGLNNNVYIDSEENIYEIKNNALYKNDEKLFDKEGDAWIVEEFNIVDENIVYYYSDDIYVTSVTQGETLYYVVHCFGNEYEIHNYDLSTPTENIDKRTRWASFSVIKSHNSDTYFIGYKFYSYMWTTRTLFRYNLLVYKDGSFNKVSSADLYNYIDITNGYYLLPYRDCCIYSKAVEDAEDIVFFVLNEKVSTYLKYTFDPVGETWSYTELTNFINGTSYNIFYEGRPSCFFLSRNIAYTIPEENYTYTGDVYNIYIIHDIELTDNGIKLNQHTSSKYLYPLMQYNTTSKKTGSSLNTRNRGITVFKEYGALYTTLFSTGDSETNRNKLYAKSICDFYTQSFSMQDDSPALLTGGIINDCVLTNNAKVSGLTLPGGDILVTEWNSLDKDYIFFNYTENEDDFYVIWKDINQNKWFRLKKTEENILMFKNGHLVVNWNQRKNDYCLELQKVLWYANGWNNRYCTNSGDVDGFLASSVNEYNQECNPSILLNPLYVYNAIYNDYGNYNQNYNTRITKESDFFINLYFGTSIEDCTYRYSFYELLGQTTGQIYVNESNINYKDRLYEGLPFPMDTNGNVQYSPSLFANYISSFGTDVFIKMGVNAYQLIKINNKTIMGFYLGTYIEDLDEAFIIQGQYYGIIDNQIFSLSFNNGVIQDSISIVSVEGLQFCGNTPYQAIFFSKTNKCLYAFTGANVLNVMQTVDKINEIKGYKYNPATQSIFLMTDKGVIINGLFGTYQVDFPNITEIFLLANGFVLCDNAGTYRYIKYYKDTDDGYTKQNIELDTCFYGMDNQTVTINDCLYLRLFSEEHEEGSLEVSAVTLSLKGRKTEKTTFKIKAGDWDKETHTIYLRYQPKEQRGLGISFKINSPFKIASMSVGSQPDAILIDKVSKGAVNAPLSTSSNINW